MFALTTNSRGIGTIFAVWKLALALAAIEAARRGAFDWAAWAIVLAALPSWLEAARRATGGPVGRSGWGIRVASEALSFGVAPAFVTHEAYPWAEPWGVVIASLYAVAAALGAARYTVEPGPHGDPTTPGLPPAVAAVLLTTAYPFFAAPSVASALGGLLDPQEVGGVMIGVLILMVSPVPYPVVTFARIRASPFKTAAVVLGAVAALLLPVYVVFPAATGYIFWGVGESVTPMLAEGVLHGGREKERVAEHRRGEDSPNYDDRYRARSTWE
jgi:phosphatidylserine synthase